MYTEQLSRLFLERRFFTITSTEKWKLTTYKYIVQSMGATSSTPLTPTNIDCVRSVESFGNRFMIFLLSIYVEDVH